MIRIFATYVPGMSIDELNTLVDEGVAGARFIFKEIEAPSFIDKVRGYENYFNSLSPERFTVIIDLPGTKARIGTLNSPITLKRGRHLNLSVFTSGETIQITNLNNAEFKRIDVGHRLLVADDSIELIVTKKERDFIQCESVSPNGILRAGRSIVFPDSEIVNLPLSPQDRCLLQVAELDKQDFKLAVSFCHSAEVIRILTGDYRIKVKNIIPKIETVLPKDVLSAVISDCEYAMLGRGDLSTMNDAGDWFVFQLLFIETCFELGVDPIIGTGLFPSLSTSSRPTISEVSDVGFLLRMGVKSFLVADDVSFTNPSQVLAQITDLSIAVGAAPSSSEPAESSYT